MMRALVVVMVALSLTAGGQAVQVQGGQTVQVQQPEPSTGLVTGLVIAQDTQRPARVAQVQLQSVASANGADEGRRRGNFGGGSVSVRTDFDGTFVANHVAVGDYYVTATAPGYIPERALLQAQVAAGGDPAAILSALPMVHVTADNTSNITVTMQRGGVIVGHVEWEDGSPASGVSVNAISTTTAPQMPAALRGIQVFGGVHSSQTDDRGNFRIADLPTGEYFVSATVQASLQVSGGVGFMGYVSPVRVFAPGVFRKADAKAISVRAGDERTDARMVIDLRGLHTVSGHANSSNPGQGVAAGSVRLSDSSDGTLQIYTQMDAEGGFKLRYVPPGTYTLQISGANSVAPSFGRGGRDGGQLPKGVAYQEFSTALTMGDTDITGMAVSLVPVVTQK